MNSKSWFIENINKIGNPQKDQSRKKIEKTQITNIKNEVGDITTEPIDITKKIGNC